MQTTDWRKEEGREYIASGYRFDCYRTVYNGVKCVVKMVRQSDEKSVSCVKNRMLAQQQRNHPNITRVIAIDYNTGRFCCFVEMMDTSLKEFMKNRTDLHPKFIVHIASNVINGAKYLRETGVVYPSIRPSNILLRFGGNEFMEVKFSDTMPRRDDDPNSPFTTTGFSDAWFSPEAVAFQRNISVEETSWGFSSWQIGLLLLWMYVGISISASFDKKIALWLDDPTKVPDELNVPPCLAPRGMTDLIKKCLSLRSRDRPTIDEIAKRMELFTVACKLI